ncbi:MAG TPA: DUF4368 domain-containing protein [Candidatus Avoscillospira avistercoris]|uniref:DUF4368 domain-containing protein n=1 Tax=Candidatus Avoscillospira avistercoris TaxID=2840707 RepID=A0A9D1F7Q6_9FIRM|nr:DUF4368 domain-containing protein [Candidatus Avoscillospira avistercoris]
MAVRQTEEKITALYERLSRDDDIAGDSNSILNQKRYLETYAQQRGYTNLVHYTDDGWSGGNFERPGWKRLVADMEAGKVAHLLCKDMSRIGRNYLQTGFYTEVMFRQYGVHFVAVANNIDSDEQESSEFAPFLNIMNEWYLRDQSKKVAAAYRVKGKAGKPTSNSPVYGYKKDPEDKDHWLVDEEAAAVVRRIFRLAVEGHGPYDISKLLTAEKVECPGHYMARQREAQHRPGKRKGQSALDKNRPYDWYGNTVSTMLERSEYMGHTVNFRSSKKSYRDKRVKNAPEDWLVFENTHEAIVDPETWKLAQQIKRTVRRTDTTGVANPFTGLVFCADCGAKMYNHRGIRKTANGKEYPSDFYNCSTYALTIERETKQCFSHNVSTRALTELVLETIRTTAGYALANRKAFIQKVRSISQVRQQEAAKELSRRVAKSKKRIAELDILMKKLYETYALGRMDEKRFELLSAGYEKEQDELEQALAADQANLDQFNEDTDRADKFLALAKKYTDFSELTPAMLNEFVEKIMVHAPDRSAGERVQEIEIYLKFIGKFDVPLPEPTPEELAAEEVRRQRRARDHAKYLRQKERKRKIAEGQIVPGEPYALVCQCCGETFHSIRPNAKFCKPACRERFYRQQKRAAKQETLKTDKTA